MYLFCSFILVIGAAFGQVHDDRPPPEKAPDCDCLQQRAQLTRLKQVTYSLTFSPDGSMLATGSGYGSSLGGHGVVGLWDTTTYARLKSLKGLDDEIHGLAFTPDGKTVFAAGHKLRSWDVATGEKRHKVRGIRNLAVSPDGKWVATVDVCMKRPCDIWILDAQSSEKVVKLEDTKGPAALDFSPDGKILAVAGMNEGIIRFWSVPLWRERSSRGAGGLVKLIRYSPDGRRLFVGWFSGGKIIRLADPTDVIVLEGDTHSLEDMSFSPDGSILATAGSELKLWDARTGKLLHVWNPPPRRQSSANHVCAVEFSRDGESLVTATWDGKVRIWEFRQEKLLPTSRAASSP